jgi:hypothetical protein
MHPDIRASDQAAPVMPNNVTLKEICLYITNLIFKSLTIF